MFCPVCEAEFVAGITQCSDCGIPLVSTLPDEEAEEGEDRDEELEEFRSQQGWSNEKVPIQW